MVRVGRGMWGNWVTLNMQIQRSIENFVIKVWIFVLLATLSVCLSVQTSVRIWKDRWLCGRWPVTARQTERHSSRHVGRQECRQTNRQIDDEREKEFQNRPESAKSFVKNLYWYFKNNWNFQPSTCYLIYARPYLLEFPTSPSSLSSVSAYFFW